MHETAAGQLAVLKEYGVFEGLEPYPGDGYEADEPMHRDYAMAMLVNAFGLVVKAKATRQRGEDPASWAPTALKEALGPQVKEPLALEGNGERRVSRAATQQGCFFHLSML